ncbi:unnamed protein product, partial [Penicillium nalgiovense]
GDLNDLLYISTRQVTPSVSQHIFDSSFRRLDDPLLIPPLLKRVRPDYRKGFILYDTISYNDFID